MAATLAQIQAQKEAQISAVVIERGRRAEYALREKVANAAAALGMPPEIYNLYLTRRIEIDAKLLELRTQADIEVEKIQKLADIEIEKERKLSELRLEHKREETKIVFDNSVAEAKEELNFGLRSTTLLPHERIKQILQVIAEYDKEIDELEKKQDQVYRLSQREYQRKDNLERLVKGCYREIKNIEKGLSQTDNRQKPKRATKAKTRTPEDPR